MTRNILLPDEPFYPLLSYEVALPLSAALDQQQQYQYYRTTTELLDALIFYVMLQKELQMFNPGKWFAEQLVGKPYRKLPAKPVALWWLLLLHHRCTQYIQDLMNQFPYSGI